MQDQLTFLQDASAAVKAEAQAGKCWDAVEKELKLPKYESWPGYEQNLPFVLRRYCGLWGRRLLPPPAGDSAPRPARPRAAPRRCERRLLG